MPCNCPKCAYVAPPKKRNIDLDKLTPGTVLKVDHQFWMICVDCYGVMSGVNNHRFGVPMHELEQIVNDAWTVEIVYEPGKEA